MDDILDSMPGSDADRRSDGRHLHILFRARRQDFIHIHVAAPRSCRIQPQAHGVVAGAPNTRTSPCRAGAPVRRGSGSARNYEDTTSRNGRRWTSRTPPWSNRASASEVTSPSCRTLRAGASRLTHPVLRLHLGNVQIGSSLNVTVIVKLPSGVMTSWCRSHSRRRLICCSSG